MQNKSGKTAVFSRDATLRGVKEVPSSALNEIPEMLKIPVFPGFPFTDRKKRGHKRGKFIKV